jgi:hypothetical protein
VKKIVQMGLGEFIQATQRTEWIDLPIGTLFVDKDAIGKWAAYEVLGKRENGEWQLAEFPLRIVGD